MSGKVTLDSVWGSRIADDMSASQYNWILMKRLDIDSYYTQIVTLYVSSASALYSLLGWSCLQDCCSLMVCFLTKNMLTDKWK